MGFTEAETAIFFDENDAVYKSFWDPKGSLHWGYFDETNSGDFDRACRDITDIMISISGINSYSDVLEAGCGNGIVAAYIAETTGCRIDAIDIRPGAIKNADEMKQGMPPELSDRIKFKVSSITDLQFADESFSHVYSQDVIYHVPNKEIAFAEINRVLRKNGTLVFTDIVKPGKVGSNAQKHFYDRLGFDTPFSYRSYLNFLGSYFRVVHSRNLSHHLMRSYEALSARLQEKMQGPKDEFFGHYVLLLNAWQHTIAGIKNNEIGWALYVCKKNI